MISARVTGDEDSAASGVIVDIDADVANLEASGNGLVHGAGHEVERGFTAMHVGIDGVTGCAIAVLAGEANGAPPESLRRRVLDGQGAVLERFSAEPSG